MMTIPSNAAGSGFKGTKITPQTFGGQSSEALGSVWTPLVPGEESEESSGDEDEHSKKHFQLSDISLSGPQRRVPSIAEKGEAQAFLEDLEREGPMWNSHPHMAESDATSRRSRRGSLISTSSSEQPHPNIQRSSPSTHGVSVSPAVVQEREAGTGVAHSSMLSRQSSVAAARSVDVVPPNTSKDRKRWLIDYVEVPIKRPKSKSKVRIDTQEAETDDANSPPTNAPPVNTLLTVLSNAFQHNAAENPAPAVISFATSAIRSTTAKSYKQSTTNGQTRISDRQAAKPRKLTQNELDILLNTQTAPVTLTHPKFDETRVRQVHTNVRFLGARVAGAPDVSGRTGILSVSQSERNAYAAPRESRGEMFEERFDRIFGGSDLKAGTGKKPKVSYSYSFQIELKNQSFKYLLCLET